MRVLLLTLTAAGAFAALDATAAQGNAPHANGFPQANGLIVFQSFAPSATGNISQLFTVNPNYPNWSLEQITTLPAAAGDPHPGAYAPAWSPDGSKVVFLSDYQAGAGHPVNLFIVHHDGTGLRKVKLQVGGHLGPAAFSPDGKRLAFEANNHLYVAQLATGAVRQLDHRRLSEGSPAWSPDGRWIAFARVEPGPEYLGAIFLIHPNGTGLHRLTSWMLDAAGPKWSPDARRIVFSTYSDYSAPELYSSGKSKNLYTIRPNGTGLKNLTHLTYRTGGALGATTPAWSPDGTQIAYTGPNGSIWIMNASGSNPRQLTHLEFPASSPAWAPAR